MPWKPPRLSKFFHNYPHLNGSLRRVNNTFDIDSPVYKKSVTTAFFIHLLWLLLVLIILLVYLHHRLYTFRLSHPIKLKKLLRLVRLLIRISICLAIGCLILEVIMHMLIIWKLNLDPDKFSFSTRVVQNQEKTKDILLDEYGRYLKAQQRKLEETFPGYSYRPSSYEDLDRYGGRYSADFNFQIYSNPRYIARFYLEANNLRLLTLRRMRNEEIISSTAIAKEKNNPIEHFRQKERARFITFFILWAVAIVLLCLLDRYKDQVRLLWMGVVLTLMFMCLLLGALFAEGMVMGDACQNPLALKKYTKGKAKLTVEPGCIKFCKEMDVYIQQIINDYASLFMKAIKKENFDGLVYTHDEDVTRLTESLTSNKTQIDEKKYFELRTNENFTKLCPKTDNSLLMSYDTDGALRSFCVGDVILEHVFVQCMAALLINALLIIILLIFIYTRDYILPYDPNKVPMTNKKRIVKFLSWLLASSSREPRRDLPDGKDGSSPPSNVKTVKHVKSKKSKSSSSRKSSASTESAVKKNGADKCKIKSVGKHSPSKVKTKNSEILIPPAKLPCVVKSKPPALKTTTSRQSPCQICPVKVQSNPKECHQKSKKPDLFTQEDFTDLDNLVRSPKHCSPRKEEPGKSNKPLSSVGGRPNMKQKLTVTSPQPRFDSLQTQNKFAEPANRRPSTKHSDPRIQKPECPPKSASHTKSEYSPKLGHQSKYRHGQEKMHAFSSMISSHKYKPRTRSTSLKSEQHQKTTSYSIYQPFTANSRRKNTSIYGSSNKQTKPTVRKLIPSGSEKHKTAPPEDIVVIKLEPIPAQPKALVQRKITSGSAKPTRTRSTKHPSRKKLSDLVMTLKDSETFSALYSEAELSCTEFLDIAEVRAPSPQNRSKSGRY